MRRHLPHLVALLLGAGAALLVACGGTTKGGIPAASAGELKSQIEDVQQAVDGGRCNELDGQLRQVDNGIEALPKTVDARLRQSLADAGDRLRRAANNECAETTPTETQTTEATETAPTETTTTETQTTETTETVPPETTTVAPPPPPPPPPAQTTPVPPPPVEPPPAEPPAPVPPATPGGGATPGNGNGTGNGTPP
jgi:cell division protein FtsN